MFAIKNNNNSNNGVLAGETPAAHMRSVELPVKKYTAVKKFTTTTLQKIKSRKLKERQLQQQQESANLSENSEDSSSEGCNSASGSASVSSLSESSTSELSDIDLEIERIEKRIQIKEKRLFPGMVVKPKVTSVVNTSKEYHPNYLKDEDGPKKELYNLERRENDFYSLLDNQGYNQDEISSWHKLSLNKPVEISNLLAGKPKNTFKGSKFNENINLQINYRYFNDWRSHIIYYKQIKGYSHNQHIHPGNNNNILYRNSNNQGYNGKRIEMKSTAKPEYCSLTEIEKKDRFIYSINAVSERSIDRSFLFTENSQTGFFSKKSTASFNSLSSQLNNITAQNQCTVNFAQKLNSLSSIIGTSNSSTVLASLPNKMVVDSNRNVPLSETHRSQVFNGTYQNSSNNSSSFTPATIQKNSQDVSSNSKTKILSNVKKPTNLKDSKSEESEEASNHLSKTIYNTTHSYTVQASKSGRHIVSIKTNTEPVQIQPVTLPKNKASDFYSKWSKLPNQSSEIKNIIQQNSLGGVINDQTVMHRDPRQISQSLIQKKFSNLISLQGKTKRHNQEILNKLGASKFHSDVELTIGNGSDEDGIRRKSENALKMSHNKIMKKLLSQSKNKIISKSQVDLDVATNSSSHFPKVIKETVRLNVM